MSYRNVFKGNLKAETIGENEKSRTYKLSYEFKNSDEKIITSPTDMEIRDIADYIQKKYLDEPTIEKVKLINDLVVFKTYRDNLDIEIKNEDIFPNLLSGFMTVYIAFLSVEIADKNNYLTKILKFVDKEKDIDQETIEKILEYTKNGLILLVFIFVIVLIITLISLFRTSKKSNSNKLKTVDNAIHILEALKDEMVKENKIHGTTYEVNVDNLVDEKSEPRKYLVEVNEILEDEINEGTIEGKNESTEKINL